MRVSRMLMIAGMALTAAGCANTGLRTVIKNGSGPDEFLVLPVKPLSEPASYNVLPPPTPGRVNLVDQNPKADAVDALGGSGAALAATTVPGSDAALVTSASRYGVEPDVRAELAAEDADFRKRRGRLTQIRLFNTDRYAEVYRREALDPYQQASQYRHAGAVTPAVPPAD